MNTGIPGIEIILFVLSGRNPHTEFFNREDAKTQKNK